MLSQLIYRVCVFKYLWSSKYFMVL